MKLFITDPIRFGEAIFTFRRRHLTSWRAFEVIHATKGGGPVLKGESSWKTVCGFVVQGKTWHVIVQYRGFWGH